jgi:hypothetical protein
MIIRSPVIHLRLMATNFLTRVRFSDNVEYVSLHLEECYGLWTFVYREFLLRDDLKKVKQINIWCGKMDTADDLYKVFDLPGFAKILHAPLVQYNKIE